MKDATIVLGLDIGDRHIGVAVGNTISRTATPLSDLPNDRSLLERLLSLQAQYHYSKIIVGLPVTATGQHGEQANKVTTLVHQLTPQLPVELILEDERFTTRSATKLLRDHPADQITIDGASAKIILESWLARLP